MPRTVKERKPRVRYGNQEPTRKVYLTKKRGRSLGADAIAVYERTGRTAQPWQKSLLAAILSIDKTGVYVHSTFGYSVPRRNGKNEVITMRELYGLTIGEKLMHTAHRTATSTAAFERLVDLLTRAGYVEGEDFKLGKGRGQEKITLYRDGKDGVINFRTRTTRGGLGEGYDVLIIDEAQEYTEDQMSTLKYVVSDSRNPQIIMLGTPPTAVSAGTVFKEMRKDILDGVKPFSGWAEWSVDKMSDVHNVDLWYQCNPAMGYQLNERKVEAEIGDDTADFNIQRLGLWLEYNLQSVIPETEWDALTVQKPPELTGKLHVGIKFAHDGGTVSVSIAAATKDGKIFIESIDCRSMRAGIGWIVDFLRQIDRGTVVIDGANGQALLDSEIRAAKLKPYPVLPTVKELIAAAVTFEQSLQSGSLCHTGQPSLRTSATNCDKRPIGTNGGFGYKSIRDDVDVSLLESAMLAVWACSEAQKAKPKATIRK